MTIRFLPLLTLSVAHGYYADGVPRGIGYRFGAASRAVLRASRIVAREGAGVLQLYVEVDDADAPIESIDGRTLLIGVRVADAAFSNVTVLPASWPAVRGLYRNSDAPDALDAPVDARVTGEVFTWRLADDARPATVAAHDVRGEVARWEVSEGSDSVLIDLRHAGAGEYRIDETTANGTQSTVVIADDEIAHDAPALVVSIALEDAMVASPPDFVIELSPPAQRLRYYVVATNYGLSDFNQLSVSDEGAAEEGVPPIVFERVEPDAFGDDEIAAPLLASGGARLVLFRSETEPLRRQRGRRIQLNRNGDVLIAHLPQPGTDKVDADVVVHISKP